MPSRLASPVLTVDMNHIAKVDPSNVDNLFSMWTIFSKCAESLENGRRLENLSWRLWNRETFCCDDIPTTPDPRPIKKPPRLDSDTCSDIPELSSSVESASSVDEFPKDRPKDMKPSQPCLIRQDSSERYRGKEKHMTPVHLVKIMEDIDKNKSHAEEWARKIATSNAEERQSIPREKNIPLSPLAQPLVRDNSDSSEPGIRQNHSVVRGFSPGRISSSYRSSTNIATADSSPVKAPLPKKSKPVFFLGSSCSDDEIDDSYDSQFEHKSKLSDSLQKSSGEKKTSFRDEVTTRTVYDDGASTEDDGVSESAIEDDDCSDWESSTDSIHSSYEEGSSLFRRVPSRPQLASRLSLLSTMLHEPQRREALQNAASRPQPPLRKRTNSPIGAPLSIHCDAPPADINDIHVPHSRPIIMTTSNTHPPAFSPRTTRRTMLATELTESLRKHLLWERQQKNTTVQAHLKRRHTAHDVTNLVDYPQNGGKGRTSKNNSYDPSQYEYHVAGW